MIPMFPLYFDKRQHVIPTSLPSVRVLGVEGSELKGGDVHVYAHPRDTVVHQQKETRKEEVL